VAPRVPPARAYAELITALLAARTDPATARFDDELDAAVADGSVPPVIARRLRQWQRASVHAVAEHVRVTVPPALAALADATDGAYTAVLDEDRGRRDAVTVGTYDGVASASDGADPSPLNGRSATPLNGTAAGPENQSAPDPASPQSTRRARRAASADAPRQERLLVAGLQPLSPASGSSAASGAVRP